MRRVVVTGMGAVTPIGIGVDTFWENVKKKTLGFGEITRFDTTDYKVHIAAEVKDFAGKDYMDFKAAKRMELFCQYAVAAAKEAFEQAGLDMEKEDPFRVGCSIGSGIGSLQAAETACHKIAEKVTFQSKSTSGSTDDLQHGSRKCFDSTGTEREKSECGNRVCNGNTFHRRGISQYPMWRCGCDAGGRYGSKYLPGRCGRFYRVDSTFYGR